MRTRIIGSTSRGKLLLQLCQRLRQVGNAGTISADPLSYEQLQLRPSLVLKRKTSYTLKCVNEINMDIMNSESGWADENIILKWFKNTLLPYVRDKHYMLIWDTYKSHKSEQIMEFLKKYPNIHTSMIVGGRTFVDQPLDISANKQFKQICKNESIKAANNIGLLRISKYS